MAQVKEQIKLYQHLSTLTYATKQEKKISKMRSHLQMAINNLKKLYKQLQREYNKFQHNIKITEPVIHNHYMDLDDFLNKNWDTISMYGKIHIYVKKAK